MSRNEWIAVLVFGAIVFLFFLGSKKTAAAGVLAAPSTPSNPKNAPSSGCSFCGVGTIAAGVTQPKLCCHIVMTACNPLNHIFPVCHTSPIPAGNQRVPNPRNILPPIRIISAPVNSLVPRGGKGVLL